MDLDSNLIKKRGNRTALNEPKKISIFHLKKKAHRVQLNPDDVLQRLS